MDRIASFDVDHTRLEPGIYISRCDGDITTYDLRFVKPNSGVFLENNAVHTIEHLFATYVRNSSYKDNVIYFGPMGCLTGFYFLVRNLDCSSVIALIKDAILFISDFTDIIPGCSATECGNYVMHDLEGAKTAVFSYYSIIRDWNVDRLKY